MMIRVLKYLFFFVLALFVLIHLLGLFLGLANIFTALILYSGCFIVLDRGFLFIQKDWRESNLRISFWMTLAMLILIELTLRYGTRNHLSDSESRGQFITTCPYTEVKLERFLSYFIPEKDFHLRVYEPNSSLNESFGNEFEYLHTYNSTGLRDVDHETSSIDSSFVIMGLGDSFTEGLGCPQDSTWIRLLDAELSNDIPGLIAINAGNSGSDPIYEIYKLQKLLFDKYRPDLVILNINASDINDVVFKGGQERFSGSKSRYNNGPRWKYLYISSHVFRMILHEVFGIQTFYYTTGGFEQQQAKALATLTEELNNNLIPYTDSMGIELILLFTPILDELRTASFPLSDIIESISDAEHVSTINMYDKFMDRDIEFQDHFWNEDIHNNSRGYGIWVEEIAPMVTEIYESIATVK
ncbi:MAG: SGNH/GDSL hydrolase family protein [Bacteroidetes bacterium]|nr:SGNH/GDSL hydrolase family protein [Bacteroidota bacterium]